MPEDKGEDAGSKKELEVKEQEWGGPRKTLTRWWRQAKNVAKVGILNKLPLSPFHFTLQPLPERELPIYDKLQREGILDLNIGMLNEIDQIEKDMDRINEIKWHAEKLAYKLGPYRLPTHHLWEEEIGLFGTGNTTGEPGDGYIYPNIGKTLIREIISKNKIDDEYLKEMEETEEFELKFPVPIPRVLIYPFPERRIEVLYVFGSDSAAQIYADIQTKSEDLKSKFKQRVLSWAQQSKKMTKREKDLLSEKIDKQMTIATESFSAIEESVAKIVEQEKKHKDWLEDMRGVFNELEDKCTYQWNIKMPNMILRHSFRMIIPEKYKHVGWITGGKIVSQKKGAELLLENPNRNDVLPTAFGAILDGLDINKKTTKDEDKLKTLNKFKDSNYKFIENWPIEGWIVGGNVKELEEKYWLEPEKTGKKEDKLENLKKIKAMYELNDVPLIKIIKLIDVIPGWEMYTCEVNRIRSFAENPADPLYLTEVAPGLDEYGWPLEVEDDSGTATGERAGIVLKDHYRKTLTMNGEPGTRDLNDRGRTVRGIPKHLYNNWTVACDPFDVLTWRNNELDTYRDDYRDGRYHPYSRTHYDYDLYIAEHDGNVHDEWVSNVIKVGINEEVTSKAHGRSISKESWATEYEKKPYRAYRGRPISAGKQKWVRRSSDKIPAFDLKALKAMQSTERVPIKRRIEKEDGTIDTIDTEVIVHGWYHIGRLYYWAEPFWTMIWWARSDPEGDKRCRSAHITTRGIAKYIVHKVMHRTMNLKDAQDLFEEKKIDLDYGPRDVGAPMIRNPWKPNPS